MKKSIFHALLGVAVLGVTIVRAAEEQKKMEAPKPAAELSAYDYFNGHWGCSGSVVQNPIMPAHPTEAVASVHMDIGKMWREFDYAEKKTKGNPSPYAAGGFWGYDAGAKKYLEVSVDSTGQYIVMTSDGWSGDTFVLEGAGQSANMKGHQRDTFTKKGASSFVHVGEMQGQDGNWFKLDEETCKKAK